jgi:hypothetical protein
MARKIDKKISKAFVVDPGEDSSKAAELLPAESLDNVVHMHEKLQRPPVLSGSTYKIKTPLSEHALYVTFNDIVLNPDTEHELRRPFEMFINSKSMDCRVDADCLSRISQGWRCHLPGRRIAFRI